MLQELESELLKQGYSKSYVKRLASELYDHYLESADGQAEDLHADDELEQKLGSVETLSSTVQQFHELDPAPKKFPFAFFVFMPAALLNMFVFAVLYLVYDWIPPADEEKKFWAVRTWNVLNFIFLAVVPFVSVYFAKKYRVSYFVVLLLAVVLSSSSMFGISVANCNQSNSVFVHSGFGFRLMLLLLPLLSLGGGLAWLGFSSGRVVGFKSVPQLVAATIQKQDALSGVLYLVALCLILLISGKLLERSLDSLKAHPIDNLVRSFNSETRQACRKLDVIKKVEFDPSQSERISSLLVELEKRISDHYKRKPEFKNWKERQAFTEQANQFCLQTCRECEKYLSDEQRKTVLQVSLKAVGWDAILDEQVREKINLSEFQFCMIKDVYLDSILAEQKLGAQWRKADSAKRPEISQAIMNARLDRDEKFSSILTGQQLRDFDLVCGTALAKKNSTQITNN